MHDQAQVCRQDKRMAGRAGGLYIGIPRSSGRRRKTTCRVLRRWKSGVESGSNRVFGQEEGALREHRLVLVAVERQK